MRTADAFEIYRPLIDEWEAFLVAVSRPLPPCIWTNTLKATPERLASLLESEGVHPEQLSWCPEAFRLPDGVKPGKLWPLVAGLYHIQEEVSLLPALLLDPRPGERVLDLCASPGNKTARMAVAMNNRGTVVSNDVRMGRLSALRNTIERLGLLNVSTTHHDGTNYPRGAGLFDRVLVDAPCSCEGTSRKNPGIIEELMAGGYRKNVRSQVALLERAVHLTRPGGRIVYSTCTYAPEENEMVVAEALGTFGPDTLELLPARVDGFRSAEGLTEWRGRTLDESLRRCMRVWPHQNDSGGFFVALLEKRSKPGAERRGRLSPSAAPARPGTLAGAPGEEAKRGLGLQEGLDYITERFGIGRERLEGFEIFQGNRSGFYIVSKDHRPPAAPRPDATGLFFLKSRMKTPKLTTAAASVFGVGATRNCLEIDRERVRRYVRRHSIRVSAGEIRNSSGGGYVLIRHQGHPLGLGLYRPEGSGEGGVVESCFPKGWAFGV